MPSRINYTKALIDLIAGCIFDGLTDEETALLAGINQKTIYRIRLGNECPAIRIASIQRMRKYISIVRDGGDSSNHKWQRIAWFLERRYPDRWAKPEVLLNVQGNSTTNNVLVITAERAASLSARASAIEAQVSKLKPDQSGSPSVRPVIKGVMTGYPEEPLSKAQAPMLSEAAGVDAGMAASGQCSSTSASSGQDRLGASLESPEGGHSRPRTPGGGGRAGAPHLSGKSETGVFSSNSKPVPSLSGKSQLSDLSSNSNTGTVPKIRKKRDDAGKREERRKEALRKAAIEKKKARGVSRGAKAEGRSGVPS
jgi:hypothetical protein